VSVRFIFDTDHLTLFEHADPLLVQRYVSISPSDTGVSVVSVEEALRGRLAALARARAGPIRIQAYARLTATIRLIGLLPIVPFDQAAEDQFQHLLSLGLRIGTSDLKVAAVALATGATLLTRNRRDFGRIPGMRLDDWSI